MDNYEQKYNEILEWARKNKARLNGVPIEEVLPELAESEDERIRRWLCDYFSSIDKAWIHKDITCIDILRWLEKQKEQKPAEWSEEDSDNLERVDNYLWMLDNYIGDDCAIPQGKSDKIRGNIQKVLSLWLKSLPERFALQPKKEWSEEDEKILDSLIRLYAKEYSGYEWPWSNGNFTYGDVVKFLKSLKPQSHWKPSEEQMKLLQYLAKGIDIASHERHILDDMIDDLKKL